MIYDKLQACLQDVEPVDEHLLVDRLTRPPHALCEEEAQNLIDRAHSENIIRWVMLRGWMWGGRP